MIKLIQCSQPNPSPCSGHSPAVVIVRCGLGLQWHSGILPCGPVFLHQKFPMRCHSSLQLLGWGDAGTGAVGYSVRILLGSRRENTIKVKSLELLCREQSLLEKGRSLHCLELSQRQWFGWGRINCLCSG